MTSIERVENSASIYRSRFLRKIRKSHFMAPNVLKQIIKFCEKNTILGKKSKKSRFFRKKCEKILEIRKIAFTSKIFIGF